MKNKARPIYSQMILYGGILFLVSTFLNWILYFFSDFFIKSTFLSSLFTSTSSVLLVLTAISAFVFGLGLMLSKNLTKFMLGFYIFVPFLIWYATVLLNLTVLSSVEYSELTEKIGIFFSTFLALTTYVYVPILFSGLLKPRSGFLIAISFISLYAWFLAFFLGYDFAEVLSTRYGGFNSIDLFFSVVQAPFLLMVWKVASLEVSKS